MHLDVLARDGTGDIRRRRAAVHLLGVADQNRNLGLVGGWQQMLGGDQQAGAGRGAGAGLSSFNRLTSQS